MDPNNPAARETAAPVFRTATVPDQAFWAETDVEMPEEPDMVQITGRFDRDVIAWFKAGGRGYQARMNAVLRSYVEAQSD